MGREIGKILTDTISEGFGLSYVNDNAFPIVHQIHAGELRQPVRFFFQFFKCHNGHLHFDSKNAPR